MTAFHALRSGAYDQPHSTADCREGKCHFAKGWEPTYRTGKDGERAFYIDGTKNDQCPFAVIKPESIEYIQLFNRLAMAKEKTGAALCGPDLTKYPSRWIDIITTLEHQERMIERKRFETEQERD